MNELAIFDKDRMSSLEIAERTGKDHKNVLRDIREMLEELYAVKDRLSFESIYYDAYNREQKCYSLPKHECMILVTGYSVTLRANVLERWQELEDAEAQRQQEALALAQQEAQAAQWEAQAAQHEARAARLELRRIVWGQLGF